MYPTNLKYTTEHEWIRVSGNKGVVGITDHAQAQLGDIVYVELPKVGKTLKQLEVFGALESVKAASDLYLPISGRITGVNERLTDHPELINQSPYDDGWMIEIEMSNLTELDRLLTAEQYQAILPAE